MESPGPPVIETVSLVVQLLNVRPEKSTAVPFATSASLPRLPPSIAWTPDEPSVAGSTRIVSPACVKAKVLAGETGTSKRSMPPVGSATSPMASGADERVSVFVEEPDVMLNAVPLSRTVLAEGDTSLRLMMSPGANPANEVGLKAARLSTTSVPVPRNPTVPLEADEISRVPPLTDAVPPCSTVPLAVPP